MIHLIHIEPWSMFLVLRIGVTYSLQNIVLLGFAPSTILHCTEVQCLIYNSVLLICRLVLKWFINPCITVLHFALLACIGVIHGLFRYYFLHIHSIVDLQQVLGLVVSG